MGRLRGKRNRDRERDLIILRRSTQSGMVGTDGLLECIFCSCLLTSYDAHFSNGGDAFCEACGNERGLITVRLIKSKPILTLLTSLDSLTYEESVSGGSGRRKAAMAGARQDVNMRLSGRAADRRQMLAERRTQRQIEREKLRIVRVFISITGAIRRGIEYRLQHPRTKDEVPRKFTDAQVEEIRKLYASGTQSFKRLGERYGCTDGHISSVVTGSCYKRAGGPLHIPRTELESIWANGGVVWPGSADRMARAGLVIHPTDAGLRLDLGSSAFDEFRSVDAMDGEERSLDLHERRQLQMGKNGNAEDMGRGSEEEVRSGVGEDRAVDGESRSRSAVVAIEAGDGQGIQSAERRGSGETATGGRLRSRSGRYMRALREDQTQVEIVGAPAQVEAYADAG